MDNESLGKAELHRLADRLLVADDGAITRCLAFFAAETRGHWHNRARAMIARRLKHVPLTQAQAAPVVDVIVWRLTSGTFTEQFKDQLRLAARLDRPCLLAAADACRDSPKEYVQRYARWILTTFRPLDAAE